MLQELNTVYTCPLGATCKEIKDNIIHQCLWLTKIAETNPRTGENRETEMCAIAWMPIIGIETANTNKGQTDAICSMRDETLCRQDKAIAAMMEFKNDRSIEII